AHGAHLRDSHRDRSARVRHRSPAVLVPARALPASNRRGVTEPVANESAAPSATTPIGATAAVTEKPPVVVFDHVTKTYDNGFTAIKDVSFVVEDIPSKMEFVTILGPSGCGKSTVLRLIAGLTPQFPATSGSVLVLGKPVEAPGADRGMVFQDYSSFDNRTVVDNVAFGLECRGVAAAERTEAARAWIHKVGLNVDRDAE